MLMGPPQPRRFNRWRCPIPGFVKPTRVGQKITNQSLVGPTNKTGAQQGGFIYQLSNLLAALRANQGKARANKNGWLNTKKKKKSLELSSAQISLPEGHMLSLCCFKGCLVRVLHMDALKDSGKP